MRIHDFEDETDYVRESIREMPSKGRGELRKLAEHAGLHTSTLSQILSGRKNFTLEQACLVAEFFGLREDETEYLLLLVNRKRAGSALLKKQLSRQIERTRELAREHAMDLRNVLPQDRKLTEEERAIFYSNWYYPAIWALTSIPGYQTRETIQPFFALPKTLVNQVVDFLLKTRICVEKGKLIQPGPSYVHLESGSPFLPRHHSNWRIKAMEKHPTLGKDELAYTSPLSISHKDAKRVRALLVELIAKVNEIRDPSPCEEIYCLNLDWFVIR